MNISWSADFRVKCLFLSSNILSITTLVHNMPTNVIQVSLGDEVCFFISRSNRGNSLFMATW